jgi:hypothetical protein
MEVFKINTSAWEEENFYLMTSLSEEQIKKIIQPMVEYERDNDILYDNEDYVSALQGKYPKATIVMYQDFKEITF